MSEEIIFPASMARILKRYQREQAGIEDEEGAMDLDTRYFGPRGKLTVALLDEVSKMTDIDAIARLLDDFMHVRRMHEAEVLIYPFFDEAELLRWKELFVDSAQPSAASLKSAEVQQHFVDQLNSASSVEAWDASAAEFFKLGALEQEIRDALPGSSINGSAEDLEATLQVMFFQTHAETALLGAYLVSVFVLWEKPDQRRQALLASLGAPELAPSRSFGDERRVGDPWMGPGESESVPSVGGAELSALEKGLSGAS